ncbi:MAG: putative rane protein, partial [Ramlibacter sp.]|nr:putative rane protein [Ramlibacter sp.]
GQRHGGPVRADRDRLVVLSSILVLFMAGGVAGAVAFKVIGYAAVLPLAALLLAISALPLVADLKKLAH